MAEKQQPWGKWFWGDWRKDARLRRCAYASRGLWADMLSLMGGECDRFGFLIMEGQSLGAGDLVGLLGGTEREVAKSLAELKQKRVYSVTGAPDMEPDLLAIIPADMPAGVIFSRRMVRDKAKADRDRENGKTGGNPTLKQPVKPRVNPQDKAQKLEPDSEAKGKDSPSEFDSFFAVFPKQEQRDSAEREFDKALAAGATAAELQDGARRYAAHVAGGGVALKFMLLAKNWLKDGCWRDNYAGAGNLRPVDDTAARAAWDGEAGKLIDALGDNGAAKFQAWFGGSQFEAGPPAHIRVKNEFSRQYVANKFAGPLKRAFGEVVLEVAA